MAVSDPYFVVQSLSHVLLYLTPRTVAHQAPLFFVIFWSLLKFMSIELTISSSVDFFSSCPQSFPASGPFPVSQLFASGGQSIGASNEHWIFMKLNGCCIFMNIEYSFNSKGRFPLGLTGLISLLSKGLSRVFLSITVQKHQFFGAQPSLQSNSHILDELLSYRISESNFPRWVPEIAVNVWAVSQKGLIFFHPRSRIL